MIISTQVQPKSDKPSSYFTPTSAANNAIQEAASPQAPKPTSNCHNECNKLSNNTQVQFSKDTTPSLQQSSIQTSVNHACHKPMKKYDHQHHAQRLGLIWTGRFPDWASHRQDFNCKPHCDRHCTNQIPCWIDLKFKICAYSDCVLREHLTSVRGDNTKKINASFCPHYRM